MSFSENFTYLRKKVKLTQEEIAEAFDISRQAVSKWETGESYPEMDKLLAICEFFKVSLNELLQNDLSVSSSTQEIPTVEDEACEEEEDEVCGRSSGRMQGIINGLNLFFCIGFYLVCGLFFHNWHPTWIVFLLIPLVGCLSDCWGSKNKIKGGISGGILFFSLIIYLLCGFYGQLWESMWIIFLLVPVSGLILSLI